MTSQKEEYRTTILEKKLKKSKKSLEIRKKDYIFNKKQIRYVHLSIIIATIVSIIITPFLSSIDFSTAMITTRFGEIPLAIVTALISISTGALIDLVRTLNIINKGKKIRKEIEGIEFQIMFLQQELTKEYANINKQAKKIKKSKKEMLKNIKEKLKCYKYYGMHWKDFVKENEMKNLTFKEEVKETNINTELYESFVRRLELKRNLGEEI